MSKIKLLAAALILMAASPFLMLGAILYLLADMFRYMSDRYEAGIDWVAKELGLYL